MEATQSNWRKDRWERANTIAQLTLHSKQLVYEHLKEMQETEFMDDNSQLKMSLADACIAQNALAIKLATDFLKNKSHTIKIANTPKKHQTSRQKLVTPADKLRLAMWFINMFDNPQEAVESVKIALTAVEKLDAKS